MKFWHSKKIIIILAIAVFFSVCGFEVANAEETAIGSITSGAVYLAALAITFLAGKIAAGLYVLIAGLIDIAIQANALLLSSPVVLSGWKIVLSFANLGFVLAIIVIAFATIFRQQNYAMKQTLWKLIVAALLVNFSLVIAGAFINIADNVTSSFASKIKDANVSTALTGLLAVQTFTSPVWEKMSGAEIYSRSVLKTMDALVNLATLNWYEYLFGSMEKGMWGDTQSVPALVTAKKDVAPEALLVMVGSIFFAVLFTVLSALTLLAVAVMMLIRYFFLGILLILSPIVWLLWIFPGTSNLWQKWWNNFLRWTFFAPIMIFFLYLAIATISVENLNDAKLQGAIQGSQQFTENLAKKQEGGLVVDIAKFGNLALVIGLIMSGLIAANSMGIYGAKTAMGAAQGAGKWMGGFVGRKGLQWGTSPLRAKLWKNEKGERTKSFGEKSVEWANKNWITRHTLGYAARGITRLETAGGENILKQHEKNVGNTTNADLIAANLTASGVHKIAIIKELQKRKLLGDVDAKSLITDGNKNLFNRYRQGGPAWNGITKGAKMDEKMAEQLRFKEAGDSKYNAEILKAATKNFVSAYLGKDIEASAVKDLFSGRDKLGLKKDNLKEFSEIFAEAMATENHSLVAKLIPTMKSEERDRFDKIYVGEPARDARGNIFYGGVLRGLPSEVVSVSGKKKDRSDIEKAYRDTMANYSVGWGTEAVPAPTTAPTP